MLNDKGFYSHFEAVSFDCEQPQFFDGMIELNSENVFSCGEHIKRCCIWQRKTLFKFDLMRRINKGLNPIKHHPSLARSQPQ